jgi:predicted nucleic acid-binding protein
MSDAGGPYLFDVGPIALAHAGTPVSDTALSYVRRAIAGEIDAIVPYPALFGAHIVLTNYYRFSNAEASELMANFMDARRIHWHGEMSDRTVRAAFERAARMNVDGWDGYYTEVAVSEGVKTILTVDTDFDDVAGIGTERVLTPEEHERLTEFLGY